MGSRIAEALTYMFRGTALPADHNDRGKTQFEFERVGECFDIGEGIDH